LRTLLEADGICVRHNVIDLGDVRSVACRAPVQSEVFEGRADFKSRYTMSRKYWREAVALAAALAGHIQLGVSAAHGETIFGSPSIVDGYTIEIDPAEKEKGVSTLFMTRTTIRLWGIAAPERCSEGFKGVDARSALAALIGRRDVRCEIKDWDDHGRALAVCYRLGVDLNEAMVRHWRGVRLDVLHDAVRRS
jgi:hypothetical protein